jgi:hypothetical protein
MTGIAAQQLAIQELGRLYEAIGEPAKAQEIRKELEELKRQQQEIRKKVTG